MSTVLNQRTFDNQAEKTCFVICPIGEPNTETRQRSDALLKHIITPAVQETGLFALRADNLASPGIITNQVIAHILEDKMVVADLTDHNANVFYELALRQAFRKPVVLLILKDQKLPFDVSGIRTIHYDLTLEGVAEARELVKRQVLTAMSDGYEVQSPVTMAAQLQELSRSTMPESQLLFKTISDQLDATNRTIIEMKEDLTRFTPRSLDLKEIIPPEIRDQISDTLRRYAEEIELLKSVRYAGIIGLHKRREVAIKAFSRYIDEEASEIMVVGSSLKGLLQKEEYKEIADKLRFKQGLIKVKYLLTHPIVADFRASQENRRPTEIGLEIIKSLETLQKWKVDCSNVRLYLGTPTCFAIKTTHQMLVNPYPYISVSFDSPCLLLEYSPESGAERPGYFFDEFKSRHFGAWDTDLAVHINDFDDTIAYYSAKLEEYSKQVTNLIDEGKKTIPGSHTKNGLVGNM
jgi:hypothetical protein